MKPTLFVLAAGMGSRYGGLKQLDGLGPHGETIMDYSTYDAIKAGFGKLVFVIRKDFEQQFREKIVSKYEKHIPVEIVFQSLDALPEGCKVPEGREKPWGTNHALWMGRKVIQEPFAVLNADDYYGADSFRVMADFLSALPGNSTGRYAMVGFRCGNTLSDSGSVSRGICSMDENGNLTSVVERKQIERRDGEVKFLDEKGDWKTVDENVPVSMNFWGFTPDYFDYTEDYFRRFVNKPETQANPKTEFVIPMLVDELVEGGKATVKVLDTTSRWFGVTYPEDRPGVVEKFAGLARRGLYPEGLFK